MVDLRGAGELGTGAEGPLIPDRRNVEREIKRCPCMSTGVVRHIHYHIPNASREVVKLAKAAHTTHGPKTNKPGETLKRWGSQAFRFNG